MPLSKEELRDRLWLYRQQNWNKVQTRVWQEKIVQHQMIFDAKPLLNQWISRFNLDHRKIRYLDLGSGIGDYVLAARKLGINAYGIEPDLIGVGSLESSLQIAKDRADNPRVFFSGVGEKLPFSDSQFDFITMNQVLEHVQDLNAVLSEALRVLKSGGVLVFNSPNYLSFYEPHYKVFWLPLCPRMMAKLYLRLRGRDPAFLDGIIYLTRNRLNSILNGLPCQYEDQNLAYLNMRIAYPEQIRNSVLRIFAKLAKATCADKMVIWIYLNFYVRGINYVVFKDKE